MINSTIPITDGIHIGLNTHIHFQSINPVSLSAMNKIVKTPKKDIPSLSSISTS